MKFGELVDYGSQKYWLNSGSDPQHIRDTLSYL